MIPQIRTDVFLFRLRVAFIEGYVHAIPESFCAGTETKPRRASFQIWEQWFRRDFCNGAKLRPDHESHIGYSVVVHTIQHSFCISTKTIRRMASVHTWERWFWREFLWRSEAAPIWSVKWRVTYLKGVHAMPDSFCIGTKTIPRMASVHTWERWFRRDFWNGWKLRHPHLLSEESHIG